MTTPDPVYGPIDVGVIGGMMIPCTYHAQFRDAIVETLKGRERLVPDAFFKGAESLPCKEKPGDK